MSNDSRAVTILMYVLIVIGIVMTYSASAVFSYQYFGNMTYFLKRELLYLLFGSLVFAFCARANVEVLRRHAKTFIVVAIIMLLLVFIPPFGLKAGGARRWIGIPGFSFQPVEFAKVAICLYLSDYLRRKAKPLSEGDPSVLLPPLSVLLVVLTLLIVQPDLGSCIFIMLISGALFFLAGVRLRYFFIVAFPVLLALVGLILKAPYRLKRIVAFLDPWHDPAGTGFQIIQSFIAFASGGWRGVGLGQSTQKLFYLPQSYTDFIFSIIGEELGFAGAVAVVLLYAAFFFFGIRIAEKNQDAFRRLFSTTLVFIITLQALINMFVTTGLVPTKGLPLPFVSYGGTSLMFNMAAAGLLVSMDTSTAKRSWRGR